MALAVMPLALHLSPGGLQQWALLWGAAPCALLGLACWGAWEGLALMGGVGSWGEAAIAVQAVCLGAAWAAHRAVLHGAAALALPLLPPPPPPPQLPLSEGAAAELQQRLFTAAWAVLGGTCVLVLGVLLAALPCGGCAVRPRGAPAAARLQRTAERDAFLQRMEVTLGSPRLVQQAAQLVNSQWWASKGTVAVGRAAAARVCARLPSQAERFNLLGLLRLAFEEVGAAAAEGSAGAEGAAAAAAGAPAAAPPLAMQPSLSLPAALAAVEEGFPLLQRAAPTALLGTLITLASAALFLALNALLRTGNCIAFVLQHVVYHGAAHPHTLALVCAWAALLLAALAALPSTPALSAATGLPPNGANLLLRKAYHALGVAILVPGALLAPSVLALALSAAVFLLVCLELARALRIRPSPLSTALHAAFSRHTDSRESTALYLTHFYLLLGMGLPLVAVLQRAAGAPRSSSSSSAGAQLELLEAASGLLALGVGDAAAAVAGTLYSAAHGKAACLPWADVGAALLGRRERGAGGVTVLGSAAFVACVGGGGAALLGWGVPVQQGCVGEVGWGGLEWESVRALGATALVGAAVEAATGSVDNAVVPIYAWAAVWAMRSSSAPLASM